MITLHTFGSSFGLPDASPFVMKAELLLKMSGLAYQTDSTTGFKNAPKGKLPSIRDGDALIADSTLIRWHLEHKYQIDFDKNLSAQEKGIAWAVEKLLEDNLYWALLDARWVNDANFKRGPAQFFKAVPLPMRGLVKAMVRRQIAKNLKAHGLGRHTQQEILAIASKNIEAVASILGDKPYLMGEHPSGADATCAAFIWGALCPYFETPIRAAAEKHPNLVAYVERMRAQYYP
ncbi:glutathione S-transferase family protein [Solimicrobium silvestre]|uniref:Glutathione S-transferase n=1 Tax=Solimicrobium silvestre TaxID=2099400 RepID=A0A2S9GYM3_9BURK|nr:glutathione S-transferase family protein [Solimicrobium silvestre]PRC92825.1 Glutathione S-transferase [Solimicrobium silvestre]